MVLNQIVIYYQVKDAIKCAIKRYLEALSAPSRHFAWPGDQAPHETDGPWQFWQRGAAAPVEIQKVGSSSAEERSFNQTCVNQRENTGDYNVPR